MKARLSEIPFNFILPPSYFIPALLPASARAAASEVAAAADSEAAPRRARARHALRSRGRVVRVALVNALHAEAALLCKRRHDCLHEVRNALSVVAAPERPRQTLPPY